MHNSSHQNAIILNHYFVVRNSTLTFTLLSRHFLLYISLQLDFLLASVHFSFISVPLLLLCTCLQGELILYFYPMSKLFTLT